MRSFVSTAGVVALTILIECIAYVSTGVTVMLLVGLAFVLGMVLGMLRVMHPEWFGFDR